MGCGTSKVLPEPPRSCYVDFVKSVVSCKSKVCDGGPKKAESMGPAGGGQSDASCPDGARRTKVAKYRAKFDPKVTARYETKALIGRGSFSRVVRVELRATKQPFAIKMIETKAKEGKEVCELELNVLRRVSHHNIFQLIEVFETQDHIYMVMELATGGELFDRVIAKGSFTERDATRVLQMI